MVFQVPDQEVARQHRQPNAEMLRCSSNREASFRGSRNLASKVIDVGEIPGHVVGTSQTSKTADKCVVGKFGVVR